VIDRDHQIPSLGRVVIFSKGKRHHVGRCIDAHEVAMEGLQAIVMHQCHRDLPLTLSTLRLNDKGGQALQRIVVEVGRRRGLGNQREGQRERIQGGIRLINWQARL
jgi:hypothetical protein